MTSEFLQSIHGVFPAPETFRTVRLTVGSLPEALRAMRTVFCSRESVSGSFQASSNPTLSSRSPLDCTPRSLLLPSCCAEQRKPPHTETTKNRVAGLEPHGPA